MTTASCPAHWDRTLSWRRELVAWAREVRGLPYIWGKTDCAALIRDALRIQFGTDLFGNLPTWTTVRQAQEVWAAFLTTSGVSYETLFLAMGGKLVQGVGRRRWPDGSILVGNEDRGPFPAFAVYVSPVVVQSDRQHGVQWSDPASVKPNIAAAWLFEEAIPYG